ncbi:hypothetical protein KV190_03250 [Thermosynechococcus sp. FA-CM-4201]
MLQDSTLLLYYLLCLILGEPLIKGLGTTGIGVLNRILGFLILAIAVQLIADGVITFIK